MVLAREDMNLEGFFRTPAPDRGHYGSLGPGSVADGIQQFDYLLFPTLLHPLAPVCVIAGTRGYQGCSKHPRLDDEVDTRRRGVRCNPIAWPSVVMIRLGAIAFPPLCRSWFW